MNLSSATVTVTADGAAAPVTVSNLAGGYGSSQAIQIKPSGWTSEAGVTYHVARYADLGAGHALENDSHRGWRRRALTRP